MPFDIVFLNALPPVVIAAALLACGVYLFLAYHRFAVAARPSVRAALFALRALLVLVLFFILLDPYWTRERENEWLGVLVDTSSSMAVNDEVQGQTRLDAVKRYFREDPFWKELRKNSLRRFYTIDEILEDATPETLAEAKASGDESRLAFAVRELNRLYGDDPGLLGWIVFTDGAATDVSDDVPGVFGDPIFPWIAVKTGSLSEVRNLSLKEPVLKDQVFTSETFPVEAAWTSTLSPGTPVTLKVELDGKPFLEKELLSEAGHYPFELSVSEPGSHVLDFSIHPQAGAAAQKDTHESDNHARAWFQASPRHLKVFYSESFYKDENFFKKALEEDRVFSVDFASSLIGFAKKKGVPFIKDSLYGLPRTREGILAYDVIVLSDVKRTLLSADQINWIRELVEKEGGALVMVGGVDSFGDGGYSNSEVEKMLPVEISDVYKKDVFLAAKGTVENPFRPVPVAGEENHPLLQLSPDKQKNEMLWKTMPNLGGYNYVGRVKPGATAILQHPFDVSSFGPRVILAVQNFGQGKVLAFTSDITPNWGQWFQEWKTPEEGWLYASFWRNAFKWLTENRLRRRLSPFDVTMTPADPEEHEPVEWTAYLPGMTGASEPDSAIQFEILQKEKRVRFREPAPFSNQRKMTWRLEDLAPGDYVLRTTCFRKGQPSLSVDKPFAVHQSRVEARHLAVSSATLEKLAAESQGVVVPLAKPRLEDALKKIRKVHLRRHSTPLWHHPVFYALVLGLLSLDWFLRKKKGLE